MMDGSNGKMEGMGGMMWGMGILWLLVIVVLVLAAVALGKYIFRRAPVKPFLAAGVAVMVTAALYLLAGGVSSKSETLALGQAGLCRQSRRVPGRLRPYMAPF